MFVTRQKTKFCTVEFRTAPTMLAETTLVLFIKKITTISTDNEIRPAGREYIILIRLPENKLPTRILRTNEAYPYVMPNKIVDNNIKILDTPIRAPARKTGGNKFSIVKAIIERLVKIAERVIL